MIENLETIHFDSLPWFEQSTELHQPRTAAAAIAAAGLDWTVSKVRLFLAGGDVVPGRYAVVRNDLPSYHQRHVLGIVGKRYTPVQNVNAFTFFDPLVKEGLAVYDIAGFLDHGKRVWILVKLPGEFRVVPDDWIEKYMVLVTSHDGSLSIIIKPIPFRVACLNMLSAILKGVEPEVRIYHTASAPHRLEQAKTVLEQAVKYYDQLESAFKKMSQRKVEEEQLERYLAQLFPSLTEQRDEEPSPRIKNHRLRVRVLFERHKLNIMPEMEGTWYALYNAVAFYVDHVQRIRQVDRLARNWFGTGVALKEKAFSLAMAEVRE